MHREILIFKAISRTISVLIASMFLFVQVASAVHIHDYVEDEPEPEVCAVCLASTQDDDWNVDDDFLQPPTNAPFDMPNALDIGCVQLLEADYTLKHDDPNVLEPPNLRLSAPRAPPV